MTAYDDSDAAICECCELPVVTQKSPGIGYYCGPCIGHVDAGCSPTGDYRAELEAVKSDHEDFRAMIAAAEGYYRRHGVPSE